MNVHKMLNTFILIFLVINTVLYLYINFNETNDYILSGEYRELLEEVTYNNNILIYEELPTYEPRPRLVLRMPFVDEQALMDRMLGEGNDDERVPSYSDESHVQETDQLKLTFLRGESRGTVYYAAKEVTYVPSVFNEEGYDNIVKAFVSDFTLDVGDYELRDKRKSVNGESIIYYFNENYEGEILFCNEVLVEVVLEQGITKARAIRYMPYTFEETVGELCPVDEAIYSLIASVDKAPEEQWTITDIEIGYYLGPDDKSRLYDLSIEPHYRIKLSTGDTFLINAYTKEQVVE